MIHYNVIPEIPSNTRNFWFTQNIWYYPIFWVAHYPMIFKTAPDRVRVPVGHWNQSLTEFSNLFDFKHLDFWTSGQFHMSKGMLHFNPILLFLFYLFWSDCHFHNYSNSLFWILILHKLLVTCFLAVGTFPQATETTVLCLASPTSISGYTASNPNYFYISLIHLIKKNSVS